MECIECKDYCCISSYSSSDHISSARESSRTTRSSSRRSSILKPPKPRQPLQNLNFNSSVDENSPSTTTKLKRRVSFAEKKHVKEFCNSLEQGTVWDETYEEHDLSNLKVSCTSNEKECEIEKQNIQIDEFHNELVCITSEAVDECSMQENNMQCHQIIERDSIVENCDLDFTNTVGNVQSTCTLLTKENILLHTPPIASDNRMEQKYNAVSPISLRSNSNRIPQTVAVYEDSNENLPDRCQNLNATSVQDKNMDFTEVICNVIYAGTEDIQPFKDTSIELTQPVPSSMNILGTINNFQQEQKTKEHTLQYRPNKFNTEITKETYQDASMELTETLPSIIKSDGDIANVESAMYCIDDRTKKFNNVSMEITAAVSTASLHSQQENINPTENCNSNLVLCDGDQRTTIFHDKSMDTTKPVKMGTFEDVACLDEATDRLTVIKKVPECKCDVTCIDEKTMEITKAIPITVQSIPKYEKTNVNFDKTVCNDTAMEFTTALTFLLAVQSDHSNSDKPAESTSAQWGLHNSVSNNWQNNDIHIISDKTVFHNTSMTTTAVVSSLNTRNTCEEGMVGCELNTDKQELGKTVLLPNISMEVTEAVIPLLCQSKKEDFIVDDNKVKELVLSETSENRSPPMNALHQAVVSDNVLTDSIEVPASKNSNVPLNEKTYIIDNIKYLKDSFVKEHTPDEVQNSVNTRTSLALHDPIEQNTYALALKENNTGTASVSPNPTIKDCTCAVSSELNKSDCLHHEHSQNIKSYSRRTYTIKPLSANNSVINSNKESSQILKINSDTFCYETNNKENCVYTALSEVDHLQECYTEEPSILKSITCLNNSFEELESIKPPSFIYLDDSLYEDTSLNASCNQELNIETNCSAETVKISENIEREHTPFNYENCSLVQDNEVDILKEDKSKWQAEPRFENQMQTIETQKLQLSHINSPNTEIQVLECASTIVCGTEQHLASNAEQDFEDVEMQNICADNSNIKDQSMECSSSKISHVDEKTSTHHNNNSHLSNKELELCDDQEMLNERNVELKETSKPCVSSIENDISIELDSFSLLRKELKACALSDDIIWDVYHENIERKLFVIGFMSCSLLVIIYLRNDDTTSVQFIEDIRITSRLADDADTLISIVHKLILAKLDVTRMVDLYKTSADVLPMLDFISREVKLAMDFMFDLKRLDDLNLMEITRDSISFISQTKRMDIILRVTVSIKPFDKIESQDIYVHCLLGSVRENDIKKLIINVKKDHKFLRRFISDVRDYIYLMEESNNAI